MHHKHTEMQQALFKADHGASKHFAFHQYIKGSTQVVQVNFIGDYGFEVLRAPFVRQATPENLSQVIRRVIWTDPDQADPTQDQGQVRGMQTNTTRHATHGDIAPQIAFKMPSLLENMVPPGLLQMIHLGLNFLNFVLFCCIVNVLFCNIFFFSFVIAIS